MVKDVIERMRSITRGFATQRTYRVVRTILSLKPLLRVLIIVGWRVWAAGSFAALVLAYMLDVSFFAHSELTYSYTTPVRRADFVRILSGFPTCGSVAG